MGSSTDDEQVDAARGELYDLEQANEQGGGDVCVTCGHTRDLHDHHTFRIGREPPMHCSQGCGCRAFVMADAQRGGDRHSCTRRNWEGD